MDDLKIKIAIIYKVPLNNLIFNGLLRGLEIDRDAIMRSMIGQILQVVEEKAKEDYPPDRYVQNDHQSSVRKFLTFFGEIHHCLAQIRNRKTVTIVFPLVERLRIEGYRQYQRESLEAAVGQAIHLLYHLRTNETRRVRGRGPSKCILWRRQQELEKSQGDWPFPKQRRLEFMMVDGTKVRLQGQGAFRDMLEMRWAWA